MNKSLPGNSDPDLRDRGRRAAPRTALSSFADLEPARIRVYVCMCK